MGPQVLVGLLVAIFVVAGTGDMMHAHAELLSDVNGSAQTMRRQKLAMEQKAEAFGRQNYIDKTYSWVSPVNCKVERCIALTFDDGPNPMTTPKVLSILEKDHVAATFFVVGSRIKGNERLLQRMAADGDEIGNHSWNHPDFTDLNPHQIKQQIALTQRAVESTGVPAPTLFRPPYGDIDKKVVSNVPMTMMFWNEDPRDWQADTPDQIVHSVLISAKSGGVVDMHDIYISTADSLDTIIAHLNNHRYKFVTASQLLGLKPGQRGLYYGRP